MDRNFLLKRSHCLESSSFNRYHCYAPCVHSMFVMHKCSRNFVQFLTILIVFSLFPMSHAHFCVFLTIFVGIIVATVQHKHISKELNQNINYFNRREQKGGEMKEKKTEKIWRHVKQIKLVTKDMSDAIGYAQ